LVLLERRWSETETQLWRERRTSSTLLPRNRQVAATSMVLYLLKECSWKKRWKYMITVAKARISLRKRKEKEERKKKKKKNEEKRKNEEKKKEEKKEEKG